ELPAAWRLRRRRGVVTWKSGEAVGTFLRRIGAAGALLELEARQVSRVLRGELNRVLNAESANLQRAVAAAGRQLDAIAAVDADGKMHTTPADAGELATTIAARTREPAVTRVICPPYVCLAAVRDALAEADPSVAVGAQNVHHELAGAYTGEISAPMLAGL